jgi:hypothetical protein
MKTRFLFPYWCKYLGVLFFIAHVPALLYFKTTDFDFKAHADDAGIFGAPHVFFMITTLLMLTGLVLFAFSKERIEDEQIAQLRMDSLQWAVYLSYMLLIISLAVTSSKADSKDLMHMAIWVPLVIFIVLFRWKMFRNSRYPKEDRA